MGGYLYCLATDQKKGIIAGVFKFLLWILSLIYGLLVRILFFLNRLRPYRLKCRVISVGNITLGGTGKTSLVEYLTRYLKQEGHKVAILTRGYKRKITSCQLPVTSYENMGDEPYMLAKNLGDVPVMVDAQRIRAAKRAIRDYAADTVILDDGFQQWQIQKDLEIVTIDAASAFGNQQLIPRGILREPLNSLKRADIILLTKTNLQPDVQGIKDFLNQINPGALIFSSMHQPKGFYQINKPEQLWDTGILKGKAVGLFSGIADPASFENLIKGAGIHIAFSLRFPDHHEYSPDDLDKIAGAAKAKNIDTVVTTEKDAARISPLEFASYNLRILVLSIKIEIKNEQEFHRRLLRLYSD